MFVRQRANKNCYSSLNPNLTQTVTLALTLTLILTLTQNLNLNANYNMVKNKRVNEQMRTHSCSLILNKQSSFAH